MFDGKRNTIVRSAFCLALYKFAIPNSALHNFNILFNVFAYNCAGSEKEAQQYYVMTTSW
jgi:hypothetical protein